MNSLKIILLTAVSISALMAPISVGLPSMSNVKTAEKTVSSDAAKLINQKVICHSKINEFINDININIVMIQQHNTTLCL